MEPPAPFQSESEPDAVAIRSGLRALLLIFAVTTLVVTGLSAILGPGLTWVAALVSAVVCFAAAVGGYFLGFYPSGNVYLVARMYGSMAARVGAPVVLLVVCQSLFPDLFGQGMVYFVVLFYVVGMLADVAIRMRCIRATVAGVPASGSTQPMKSSH